MTKLNQLVVDVSIDGAIEGGMFLLGICLALLFAYAFAKLLEIL